MIAYTSNWPNGEWEGGSSQSFFSVSFAAGNGAPKVVYLLMLWLLSGAIFPSLGCGSCAGCKLAGHR